ncbi:AI-2E family transporter [Acetobacter okinawensis]|uniref:AI-2E family transporter n=1 Tax=Acetobacter okinawensis TaxID=1076594 RepID=UPI00046FB230|nr:AI-2E family transporter [Acetobacter okinawensis]MBS0965208.1 AI-2E family transporter [Acetobacter okinawensis]MBS0989133.1 AI-2E family transporter [Acetobacter okinawensis]MCP1213071.1 AI-2E family transporter [Acetobacter okinawensis]
MPNTPPSSLVPAHQRCGLIKASQRSKRGQEMARSLLALFIVGMALYTIQGFLPALAWGGVFAIATWPLYSGACRMWPNAARGTLLPLLFTAVMALLFVIPLTLFTLEAIGEAQSALEWLDHARKFGVPVPEVLQQLPLGATTVTHLWETHLSNPRDVSGLLGALDNKGVMVTRALGSQIAHRGTLFCFSILTLFFLYKDGVSVIRQCRVASSRAFGRRGESIARQIVASIHGSVQGLVLVGIGEGVLMGLVYLFAHAPHPALFGVMTAVAAMIPFCAMIAISLVSLLILVSGASVAAIVTFCIGATVIFVADHFVRPTLIGGTTKLPFLWVLLGILGGAEMWGLIGLFIGPAAMAALNLIWRRWTYGNNAEV